APANRLPVFRSRGVLTRKLHATVADTIAEAQVFVGNYLNITNQQIEFYKLLTDEELTRLGLKRGEIKRYA
ncbi:MAG: hypothetical protein WBZ16_01760, partial [Pseudolabrys sp.]